MIYGHLYRAVMRLAHRFDWHYAPMIGPLEDGSTQRWCKWCGFRETYGLAVITDADRKAMAELDQYPND